MLNTAEPRRGGIGRTLLYGPVPPQDGEGRLSPSFPFGLSIKTFAHALWILLITGFFLVSPSGAFSQAPHSAPMLVVKSQADERLRTIEVLRELVKREPDNIRYRIRLGWWLVDVDFLDEAMEQFTKALELNPNDFDAVWGLTIVHQRKGENEAAIEVLRRYLQRRPGDLQARRHLAEMSSFGEANLKGSVTEYEKMLKRNPGDIETAKKLGSALVRLKRYEDAILVYERLVKAHPEDREFRLEKARVLSWAKRYEESLAEYDVLLSVAPENRVYLQEKATVASWAGRHDESIALYRQALERDPTDVRTRLALAEALNWSGRRPESIREFEDVLAADPKNVRARLGLARALSWSGKMKEAIRVFGEIKQDDPKNIDAHLGLADVYQRIGDSGRAEAEYHQVLMLDPGNKEAEEGLKIVRELLAPRGDMWYATFFDSNDFVRHGIFATFAWYPIQESLVEIGYAFSTFHQGGRGIQRNTPSLKVAAKPSPYLDLTFRYKYNAYSGQGSTNNFLADISYRALDATVVGFTFNRLDIVDSKGIFAARGYNPIINIDAIFQKIQSSDFTPWIHHDFSDRLVLDGNYTYGDQSDANQKNETFAQLSYRVLRRKDRFLDVRGNVYYLGYKDQSPFYFSPDILVNTAAVISWHHEVTERFFYDVENALQYEYLSGESGVANQFLARLGYKITNDTEISVSGFSFVESVNAFRSGSFLVGLSHRF